MEITLAKIAEIVGGEAKGDLNKIIYGAAPLETATPDDITFAGIPKYLKRISETRAGAVIVPRDFKSESMNLVLVESPQLSFAKVLEFFYTRPKPEMGINPGAHIGKGFVCGDDVSIGPSVVLSDHVTMGSRVTLHPCVVIGRHVEIGDDVEIFPNVSILDQCRIGSRVTIHAGTVIGSDGFGFSPDGDTYYKIPQTGIVQIDDDVEIGAGNTIDRATMGKTWIKQGVKTDNLVHIAHNVIVGENTILTGQVGIAGSVTIGKHVVMAGQSGVANHLTIGDNVTIGPKAGILKSVPKGEIMSGMPEMPHRLWLRVHRTLLRLPELKKKISELEKRLTKIEEK